MIRLLRSWWRNRGAQRRMSEMWDVKLCPRCAGTGRQGSVGSPACPACHGTGLVDA